jgi:glycosyltransferase involved in cell wall biosynthesis
MDLTIIIPAYNEESAIQAGKLDLVIDWVKGFPGSCEVLVVDDGSLDCTASCATKEGVRVITVPHRGKAGAIVSGFQQACGDILLFTDMDQATPIGEAALLLNEIKKGADIAVGSRGMVRQGAPLSRYLMSWAQIALRSLLLGLQMTDTQCGFKAFRRVAALEILERLRVYHPDHQGIIQGPSVTSGFDVELLFVGKRLGYCINEIPVQWNYQQSRRVSLRRDALRGLQDLLRIVAVDLRGEYPRFKGDCSASAANKPIH